MVLTKILVSRTICNNYKHTHVLSNITLQLLLTLTQWKVFHVTSKVNMTRADHANNIEIYRKLQKHTLCVQTCISRYVPSTHRIASGFFTFSSLASLADLSRAWIFVSRLILKFNWNKEICFQKFYLLEHCKSLHIKFPWTK
jgi:hypothetical protein